MTHLFSVAFKKTEAHLEDEVPTDVVNNRKGQTLSSGAWKKHHCILENSDCDLSVLSSHYQKVSICALLVSVRAVLSKIFAWFWNTDV